MKIMMHGHHAYPHVGGYETYLCMLAKSLASEGHQVIIYTYEWKDLPKREEIDNFEIVRSGICSLLSANVTLRHPYLAFQQLLDLRNLNDLIEEKKIDIFHIHGLTIGFEFPFPRVSIRKKIFFKGWTFVKQVPKVITFHEFVNEENWRSVVHEAEACDAIICNNKASANLLAKTLRRKIVTYIPNGVDLDLFNPGKFKSNHDSFVIFNPSRISEGKAIDVFIEAIKILVKDYKIEDIKCILTKAGLLKHNGRLLDFLHKMVDRYRLSNVIKFIPSVLHDEMPSLYAKSDIVVLSSVMEGFGISIIEGMAMRKPVIATNVGGVSDVLEDGVEGFLVRARDPVKLAEAILRLYKDERLRYEMGSTGRKKVEEVYSWDKVLQDNILVYNHVLQKFG